MYQAQIPECLCAILISKTGLAVPLNLKNYELENKLPSLHKLPVFNDKKISVLNSIIKEAKKDPQ